MQATLLQSAAEEALGATERAPFVRPGRGGEQQARKLQPGLWPRPSRWQHFDIRCGDSFPHRSPLTRTYKHGMCQTLLGVTYPWIWSLLLCCHCRHSPDPLTSFSFKQGRQSPGFQPPQPRARHPQNRPPVLYSFKWTFPPPSKLGLFLNPIFSVLNKPCLKQRERNPSNPPSCLQVKVASSWWAQATKPSQRPSCCTRRSLQEALLYLDYIKKYSLRFTDGNFLANFCIINPLVSWKEKYLVLNSS